MEQAVELCGRVGESSEVYLPPEGDEGFYHHFPLSH